MGIMSSLAIVVSLAVSDETRIDKDTIFYVVPLLVQFFAAFFLLDIFRDDLQSPETTGSRLMNARYCLAD